MSVFVKILKQILVFLFLAVPLSASAQWSIVAPNVFPQFKGTTGHYAMTFRDGILWLATDNLLKSTDLGSSWTTVSTNPWNTLALDVQFFDRSHGLVSTGSGLFITSDQGITWTPIRNGDVVSACYGNNSSTFATCIEPDFTYITTDAGASWTESTTGLFWSSVSHLRDGSFVALQDGVLLRTTDFGVTWSRTPSAIGRDSYSLAVDSCDLNLIYVSNENYSLKSGGLSQLFRSPDGGATWQTPFSNPIPFLCGSIAVTLNAEYLQTITNGVYRSTDLGMTWSAIGGPSNNFDTRLVCAIDDNVIVAPDVMGNIWRTNNSGGDSVFTLGIVTASPDSVFFPDSLSVCDQPDSVTIQLAHGCRGPFLSSVAVTSVNSDSQYFRAYADTLADSIVVSFQPNSVRAYDASLMLTLTNGKKVIVPLSGFGKPPAQVTLSATNVSSDTIGTIVYIPILSRPAIADGDLALSLHYDTSMLVYRGTYLAPSGTVDQTISRSIGFARLHFAHSDIQSKDSIIAYAAFELFPEFAPCTTVLFDSMNSTNANGAICTILNQSESSFSATICSSVGCGTSTLSTFLRYHKLPTLSIIPNPATDLTALHSDMDLGTVDISTYDMMGILRASMMDVLNPSHPITLNITTLPSGVYSIHITCSGYASTLNLMHLR